MLEKIIKAFIVPVIIVAILMGCITVTFTAASQINNAVLELSSAVELCAAEINELP